MNGEPGIFRGGIPEDDGETHPEECPHCRH
jgi:hypothetical protein